MYEERRETFSIKDIILQILLIVLFVLILVWVFPTKGYVKNLFGKNVKTEQTTKVEASSDDIDKMAVLYNQVFANNIYTMKEAVIGYYTNERLPQTVGDTARMTLEDMYNKHLVLKLTDKDGNYCDAQKSYVSITKYENEFQMKVNLSCGDDEDYIIVYLGCYDYCDATGVCEKQEEKPVGSNSNVVTPNIPESNPSSNSGSKPSSNPTSNPECNQSSNPTSNPGCNSNSNPTSNPGSNPSSNPTSNPESNSNSNPTSNPSSNPTSNPESNPSSNPSSNPTSNPNTCDFVTREDMTIIFDTVGGNKISSINFCTSSSCNEVSVTLPTPIRDGYKFLGWYADSKYTKKINITSSKSSDISSLEIFDTSSILDADGCGRTDKYVSIIYAKWEKIEEEKKYVCEYEKSTEGFWGPYGEWSEWSKTEVTESSSVFVEKQVKKEVTGYKEEKVQVGTKIETVKVGEKVVSKIVDYVTDKKLIGYKYDKVESGEYTTKRVKTGTKEVQVFDHYEDVEYVAGYKYVAVPTTVIQKQAVTKTIKGETTCTDAVYSTEWKYVGTGSGTTIPNNTSEYRYEKIGSSTNSVCTCPGCVCGTETIYTWKIYKKTQVLVKDKVCTKQPDRTVTEYVDKEVTVYKAEKQDIIKTRKEAKYITKTVDVYETKKVPVYKVEKVPVYETIKRPVYGVETIPVYEQREVAVYDYVKVEVYGEVTYYRYRVREYIGGTTETVWSTCDPVDSKLIEDGFNLTGNKKEA